MAEQGEGRSEVDWRAAVGELRAGRPVEIPCSSDVECQRREEQLAKRAERQGLSLEVRREDGLLRIQPHSATPVQGDDLAARAAREDRRRERAERRSAVRSERGERPDLEE